jgi:NADH:ubiquinone oxidoreductase subunit 5 (subunit L)/multisubunit Na+/H+ antiporter MnhA subunit
VKGWPDLRMAGAGTLVALAGIAGGVWIFGMRRVDTEALKRRFPNTYGVFENCFYFDLTYRRLLVDGYMALADRLAAFDGAVIDGAVNGVARAWSVSSASAWRFDGAVIDGAVNGLAAAVVRTGARVRRLQAGEVQGYQRFAYGSLLVLLASSLLAPLVGVVPAFAGGAVAFLIMGVVVLRGA